MKLAAIGSNCIDYYINLGTGKAFPGGGPVNMAVYTVRLGGEAAYIGPVGNDYYGQVMIRAMERKGVDITHLSVKEGKTAVSQVELIDGERVFGDYDKGVLESYVLTESDMEFIAQFDVAVCDVWGEVEGQLKDLKARGVVTAFDCATSPEAESSRTALPYTDYLFFSAGCGDTPELRNQMRELHARGPRLVICMMGESGSICFDGEIYHKFGIVPCENPVDSMGAGDSYISGFLSGITEGLSIEAAMEKGAAAATETLGYFGAW